MGEGKQGAALEELSLRLQAHSARLNDSRAVPEPQPTSAIPIVGPLLQLLRRVVNRLATRWYVTPIVEQQQRFNAAATAAFDDLAALLVVQEQRLSAPAGQIAALSASVQEPGQRVHKGPAGVATGQEAAAEPTDRDEVAALFRLSSTALRAWEQADCPEGVGTCHESEVADLRDADLGINFPLYWLIQDVGWHYLLNMAVVGPALNCRPGDLVLDFAGSSGWASEFLNRFGINTVLFDYSGTPLRHSRLRFAADRRLLQHAQVYPVRGDGMRLPFADNSLDGIICMNAFHHMPSYETTLREMARVLKPGCRAAFGEPGEGHARVPVSRWTMEQQHVYEKNVPLDLIYVYAMRSGFSRMVRCPYPYPDRVELPYPETGRSTATVLDHLQEILPTDLAILSLFALQKDGERPVDSNAPPAEWERHHLRGEIVLLHCTETAMAGRTLVDRVLVRNTGGVIWLATARPLGGYVQLGLKLCDQDGHVLTDCLERPALPHDIAPGEEVELDVPIQMPTTPGTYILKYDLVNEWRTSWFEVYGTIPAKWALVVLP